ncbi:hydroxysteroid 11-beta-dehydrogenase 1-like protein [Paramacrobiotus metropolitanus]|uniref:hydroxysteroid 11-beta-dehydrogenase 1-like protein n=1 Tax=Paramacrobiotus metropolitanus TaxID=2943436 RepID=UPI0024458B81|nr:hydroxysteroid 11-beta-dehydrogenase 1-like protein [Paramacrobiotus metropolitanus]
MFKNCTSAFIAAAVILIEELANKVAIVTGASTGIGEEIAYLYCQSGASVFIISRRQHVLEKVAKRCLELGGRQVAVYAADMGVDEDIQAIPQVFKKHFPESLVDHLILNHKLENQIGSWRGTAENLTQLYNIINVNFYGYVKIASLMRPFLEQSAGSIGVVSSASGRSNSPYIISYSSSKHALDGFFAGWRLELEAERSNVSITYCTLGLIETENMRKEINNFRFENFNLMSAVSAKDTATAIVMATVRRYRELYFPWFETKIPLLFRYWFPVTLDKITAFLLKAKQ